MSKVVVPLTLPRVVVGTLRRCRDEERVLVTDTVPVLVPSVAAESAPVVARLQPDDSPYAVQRRSHEVRLLDGALWRPLEEGGHVDGIAPEALAASLAERLPYLLGMAAWRNVGTQEIADWRAVGRDCAKARGVAPAETRRFASVSDDGRGEQAALAARVQGNLVVVDGRLHHRSPAPHIQVEPHEFSGIGGVLVKACLGDWSHAVPERAGHPPGWRSFAIDDAAGARAFATAMAASAPPTRGGTAVEVIEHDLGWCVPGLPQWRPSLGEQVRDWASGFVDEARSLAGHLDDRTLEGYLALRRLCAGPLDDAAAARALEGLREMSSRLGDLREEALGTDQRLHLEACRRQARGILTRVSAVEAHRHGGAFVDPDAEALEGLGVGM